MEVSRERGVPYILLTLLTLLTFSLGRAESPPCSVMPRVQCCNESLPQQCHMDNGLMNSGLGCTYMKVNTIVPPDLSTDILYSSGKPLKLGVRLNMHSGFHFINITWMFPLDATFKDITSFLMNITFNWNSSDYNILRNFSLSSVQSAKDHLETDSFIYDCITPFPNTTYKIAVKSVPSYSYHGTAEEYFTTGNLPAAYDANGDCSSQWVALMWSRLDPTERQLKVEVCFIGAPKRFNFSTYYMAITTEVEFNGNRNPLNYTRFNVDPEKMDGETKCLSFVVDKPEVYFASVRPEFPANEGCSCHGNQEICLETILTINLTTWSPPTTTTAASASTTITTTAAAAAATTTATTTTTNVTTNNDWITVVVVVVIVVCLLLLIAIVVLLYCFLQPFKDLMRWIRGLDRRKKILMVFVPSENANLIRCIREVISRLTDDGPYLLYLLPTLADSTELKKTCPCSGTRPRGNHHNRVTGRSDTAIELQRYICGMCSKCSDSNNEAVMKEKLMQELSGYKLVIAFHTTESYQQYKTYRETGSYVRGVCSVFLRLLNAYGKLECCGQFSQNNIPEGTLDEQCINNGYTDDIADQTSVHSIYAGEIINNPGNNEINNNCYCHGVIRHPQARDSLQPSEVDPRDSGIGSRTASQVHDSLHGGNAIPTPVLGLTDDDQGRVTRGKNSECIFDEVGISPSQEDTGENLQVQEPIHETEDDRSTVSSSEPNSDCIIPLPLPALLHVIYSPGSRPGETFEVVDSCTGELLEFNRDLDMLLHCVENGRFLFPDAGSSVSL